MKIAEIEAQMKQGNCSDKIMELFRTALRRVPESNRCQHCYVTAAAMPLQCHEQALSLIAFGVSEHCCCWVDLMRSFYNMGSIYEAIGDYQSAQKNYNQALLSIDEDKRASYTPEYMAHMMRTEMHISGFEYTEDLNRFYSIAIQADAFSQSFKKKMFYRFLAEVIIFRKQGEMEKAKASYYSANEMLKPGFVGLLTNHLKRKGYPETTDATKEATAFLKRAKQYF